MGNSLLWSNQREASGEIDRIAIDYKLKLIAFQDELFQSRKKLQDSDRKMADLQKKLDDYVRNKENQIAEVMFTAHMNAQRIEAQVRSQTEYIILEMEEEMRRKEKELEVIHKKTNRFMDAATPENSSEDMGTHLQIVQDNIRAFREQIEVQEITDVSEENNKPGKTAKVTAIHTDKEREPKAGKEDKAVAKKIESIETVELVQPAPPKKRRVVTRKSVKIKTNEEPVSAIIMDTPAEIKEQAESNKEPVIAAIMDTPAEIKEPTLAVPEAEVIKNSGDAQEQAVVAGTNDNYLEAKDNEYQPASLVEPNERMRLDAFVDARYYNIIGGQKQMEHHALQVTIEVEVPPDNYSVRYTKVSSDVVSTLLQYDNVVLNDIFPFNILEPNPQNIALYFFNCLEDMLSMMDLVLHSLVLLELPDLEIHVNTRNTKLDKFLHQGDDVLDSIRDSLIPCVEIESDAISPLKGTFSRMLKKRN